MQGIHTYFCKMIQINDTIVSEELRSQQFVCNLKACKGICCVEGDAGAPLEQEEADYLEEHIEKIKPYMNDAGHGVIARMGVSTTDREGDLVTPLVNNAECAFVVFDEDGTAKCAIENACNDGVIDFKKPISCHLYPVRAKKFPSFTAVNYHEWHICSDACALGEELGVKVYEFLKEPLIRKFGEEWYEQMKEVDEHLSSKDES